MFFLFLLKTEIVGTRTNLRSIHNPCFKAKNKEIISCIPDEKNTSNSKVLVRVKNVKIKMANVNAAYF